MAVFTINGVQYFKFILDSNQSGGAINHVLSIEQLQIYTTNNKDQTTTTFNPDGTIAFDATTHLAYNLNVGGLTANYILTHANGSGIADMYAYIPTSDFYVTDQYIILYFFAGTNYESTGGFEEWSAAMGPSSVPDHLGFLPVVAVMMAMLSTHAWLRRRRFGSVRS